MLLRRGAREMHSRPSILIRKALELRGNAHLTRAQLEKAKLARFRNLVQYAAKNSPYYEQLITGRQIETGRCTPSDFPPLTKAVLMANFDRIVTDRRITKQGIADFLTRSHDATDLFLNKFRVLHTSGSSGEVGYFVFSPDDWARGAAQGMRGRRNRRALRRKRRFGRLRLAYYGAIGGHFAGVTMISEAARGLAKFFVKLGLYEVNSPLSETIGALNAFQPDVLAGYTGALTILAEKQRHGLLHISPIAIGTVGESMSRTDKKVLEDAFGCPANNGYACTEHGMMGAATPGGTLLLRDDDLIYEMFEDHTLVTNLFNYTLPLIRYRMADILRPVTQPSEQSSPYLEIESLVGRSEMMPRFLNQEGAEDFISPHTINEIFVAGVTRFQMQLTGESSFRFAVCLDSSLNAEQRLHAVQSVKQRLTEILQEKRMTNVQFTVQTVSEIPVNPTSRKFQLIVTA